MKERSLLNVPIIPLQTLITSITRTKVFQVLDNLVFSCISLQKTLKDWVSMVFIVQV